jgi:DNA-binding MurR/RpiR family transcriptional regulator
MKELGEIIKENYQQLTPTQKKIAQRILKQQDKLVSSSITQCSEVLGVSEASVTRFVVAIGFSGYSSFQDYLGESLRNQLQSIKKIAFGTKDSISDTNFVEKTFINDVHNLQDGLQYVDVEKLKKLAERCNSARRVYILGMGIAKSIVCFLEFRMRRLGIDVRVLSNNSMEMLESMLLIDKQDILLSIAFQKGYYEITLAVDYAKENGAFTAAITENPLSPIARECHMVLYARRGSPDEWNSLVVPMSLSHALVMRIAGLRTTKQVELQNKMDDIRSRYDSIRLWSEQNR